MDDIAIKLTGVSKFYKLYDQPKDRLKEALHLFNKKYHKPFYALKDIDLEVRKGDILGIVGRNGCGKSTLLKIITGVLKPDDGDISVKGKITALLELGAGFNPEFTGIDNIQFYAKVLGISDHELKEKLPSIIAFAELGDFLYQPVKTYSSGMKSRLGFAVSVHVNPDILILDEVMAVGDAAFQAKCYREIRKFFEHGKTVILVSHNYQNIVSLCNRAILIADGSVIKDGQPKEVWALHKEIMFNPRKPIDEIVLEMDSVQQEKGITQIVVNNTTDTKNKKKTPDKLEISTKITSTINSQQQVTTNSGDCKHKASGRPHYANEYGEFNDIHITDLTTNTLEKKDNLYKNTDYKITIRFKSFVNMKNAWFGVQVRSTTGVIITGTNQKDFMGLPGSNIAVGETAEIEAELNCLLNAGNYFISCFVISDNEYAVIADEFSAIEVQSNEKNGGMVNIINSIKSKIIKEDLSSSAQGSEGGAWTESVHNTLHPSNLNKGLADYLSNELDFKSVLEFGSGLGLLAKHVSDNKNLKVYHCIEPNHIEGMYNPNGNPKLFPLDIFCNAHPEDLARKYELICSIEVAEHIPLNKHEDLFNFLVSKASKWIVFSGARIGQGGHGHIAERNEEEWKAEFVTRGCVFLEDITKNIRIACDSKNINHRKNLLVFTVSEL